jgi:hypothetical protein
LENDALFSIQIESGRCHRTDLQIDIIAADGVLQREQSYPTKHSPQLPDLDALHTT